MLHLLTKPLHSGMPEMENEATSAVSAVRGMKRIKPPSLFKSAVPVAQSIEPELRNSKLLKVA